MIVFRKSKERDIAAVQIKGIVAQFAGLRVAVILIKT